MVLDYKDSISEARKIVAVPIFTSENNSSVITFGVPTYKRAETLRETLNSIIAQKGSYSYNIIVSDNNPYRNDETEKLLVSSYSNINGLSYYKYEVAMPPAWNFNKLLELCHTKYLIMVHDDDELLPNFLLEMMKAISKFPKASVIKFNEILWDGIKKPILASKSAKYYNVSLKSLLYEFKIAPTGCLMNVEDHISIGGFCVDALPATDYALIAQLLMAGKQVVYFSKQLMYYRCANNDTSNPLTQEKLLVKDAEIKQAIGEFLGFPQWYVKLSVYFISTTHKIAAKRILSGKKKITEKIFFLFAHVYSFLSGLYFREEIK